MSKQLPKCKCGCGNTVERRNKRYFSDHFKNPPSKNTFGKKMAELTEELVKEVIQNPPVVLKVELPKPKPISIPKPIICNPNIVASPRCHLATVISPKQILELRLKNMDKFGQYLRR